MSKADLTPEQQRTLETLRDLESKGGAAGYKANPTAFQAFSDRIYDSKSQDDMFVEALENAKALGGWNEASNRLQVLAGYCKISSNPGIRGLLPKLQAANGLSALDSVIKDARNAAVSGKGPKTGFNPRVFETLQKMEALGGSTGFEQAVTKAHSMSTRAVRPSGPDEDGVYTCPNTYALFVPDADIINDVAGGCMHMWYKGYFWAGENLPSAEIWDTFRHDEPENWDGKVLVLWVDIGHVGTTLTFLFVFDDQLAHRATHDASLNTSKGEEILDGKTTKLTETVDIHAIYSSASSALNPTHEWFLTCDGIVQCGIYQM